MTGLLVGKPQAASRQTTQLFALPVCSHDSHATMRVRTQKEMSELVRHDSSQNIRQSDVPVGMQLHRPVKEDIAVAAGAFGRQEGHPKHFACRTPGTIRTARWVGHSTMAQSKFSKPDHVGAGAPTRPAGRSPAGFEAGPDPGELCSPARTRASGPTWFGEGEQFFQTTSSPARSKILAASCSACTITAAATSASL